jgi:hypothetical protein
MCRAWNPLGIIALALIAATAPPARADRDTDIDIVYPPKANVYNVVRDGGVDNTGKTDVTAKLQKLIAERANSIAILYFPKGTYLVSGSLIVKIDRSRKPSSHSHGPWIVGEKRSRTIIRLKDGTWPKPLYDLSKKTLRGRGKRKRMRYPSALDRQVVLSTGDSTNTTFSKIIRNLTINVGRDNAGAIGVQYCTSNSGFLGEVTIVSEDGQGTCGLALAGVENGPGQVRNVHVRGFDVGFYNRAPYTMSCSRLTIEDPNKYGVVNAGMIAGESFDVTMSGPGPAIKQDGRHFALLGARLKGVSGLAFEGSGRLYLRDAQATGFDGVLKAGEATVKEYHSGKAMSLFDKPAGSLKLEIKRTPILPYETDMSKWANVLDYGAEHVAFGDGPHDSTEAFQKALADKTKTHVMVPYGSKPWKHQGYRWHKVPEPRGRNFWVRKSLVIPPHVTRIVGVPGSIRHNYEDKVRLIVEGDSDVPLIIEGMRCPPLIIKSGRTVVLSHSGFGESWGQIPKDKRGYDLPPYIVFEGTGEVFMNDVSSPFQIKNPKQKVWVRFYNGERDWWFRKPSIDIYAGQLWLLGWKSEGFITRIMMESGACEVIGYNSYSQSRDYSRPTPPLFDIRGGRFSAINTAQAGTKKYPVLVRETRRGETKTLNWKTDNAGSPDLGLYVSGGGK